MVPRHLRGIYIWLITGCVLIAAMVTIGGITRLTGSGLSITEWDVIMGALPPLSASEWRELFAKYQATPQYQQVNAHFGLAEFKQIFWWEYLHRLLGRAIGIVFLVPFLYFLFTRRFTPALRNQVLLIFALGAFQGVLGWFMVASGLVDRPNVSHYRLAAHLLTALLTFAVTLWVALSLGGRARVALSSRATRAVAAFAVLLMLQITYGAFTAGLRAGGMFNTFPLMGESLVPPGVGTLSPVWTNLTQNPITVQLIHRLLAWLLLGFGLVVWRILARERRDHDGLLLGSAILLQFGLGVLTILGFPAHPVFWGAVHQAGAVVLLTATVVVLHRSRASAIDDSRLTIDNYVTGARGSSRLVPEPIE
jgi:cytochrome c oxidase assembly protein subunit 15